MCLPSMCVVGCSSEGTDVGRGDAVGTLEPVGCCISAVQYNTSDCNCFCLKRTRAQTQVVERNYDIKTKMSAHKSICVAKILDTVTIISHHHVYIPSGCSSDGTDVGGGDVVDTLEAMDCCISVVQYNKSDCVDSLSQSMSGDFIKV